MKNVMEYKGSLGGLLLLNLKNMALIILTLGFYIPFAEAKIMQYQLSHQYLNGKEIRFLATGRAIAKSAILMLGVIVAVFTAIHIFDNRLLISNPVINLALLGIISYLIAKYIYLYFFYIRPYYFIQYKGNHSTWNGTHARETGSSSKYAHLAIKSFWKNFFTLGFARVQSDLRKLQYIANNFHYGSEKSTFLPDKKDIEELKSINIKSLLLAPFTLFLSRYWYRAAKMNVFYKFFKVGSIGFQSQYSGLSLMAFNLSNRLLSIIALLCYGFLAWDMWIFLKFKYVGLKNEELITMAPGSDLLALHVYIGLLALGVLCHTLSQHRKYTFFSSMVTLKNNVAADKKIVKANTKRAKEGVSYNEA